MRPEKKQIVGDLSKQVGASPYVLLTEYTGLSVAQFADLRRRLLAVSAECHVVKNTLLRRALEAAGLPSGNGSLTGMTAIVVGSGRADISAAAKVLKQFNKETQKPKFKLGVLGKQLLRSEDVIALADLPTLNELRAQLVGLLQTPATRIAVVLGAPASQIARVLKAHADKQGAAAPGAAAPA
jgi:large subunit ribosomal protein L10